jgi:DNA-binding response OmpR family regulator
MNRLDIVIYEEDYLTRALLQEWLSQAGYRVRVGRAHDATLIVRRIL